MIAVKWINPEILMIIPERDDGMLPGLLAIDSPAVAVAHGARLHVGSVRAVGGLGDRESEALAAREQGVLARIERDLAVGGPIGALPYTRVRDYRLNGNRTRLQELQRWRSEQIELAAMAVLFGVEVPAASGDSLTTSTAT